MPVQRSPSEALAPGGTPVSDGLSMQFPISALQESAVPDWSDSPLRVSDLWALGKRAGILINVL